MYIHSTCMGWTGLWLLNKSKGGGGLQVVGVAVST